MIHRWLNSLILLPDRYCYQEPADLGLHAETVVFPNAQGVPLHGLFCQSWSTEKAAHTPPGDRPVVLFCPGTSGNLSSHLHYVELLCRAGCAVLGFDYTGFGQSAGTASLQTLGSDVLCAGDFLRTSKQVERFGLFGLSIGANTALLAAALRPDVICGVAVEGLAMQQEVIRGILTRGIMGPRHIDTMVYDGLPQPRYAAHVLNRWHMRGWMADMFAWLGVACFPFQGKAPQRQVAALKDTPVLFIHGAEDPLLPFEATLQVYDAKPGAKRLWLIPGVGHAQEPVLAQDAEYAAQLGAFFHDVLPWQHQPHVGTPAITCEVVAQPGGAFTVQLRNPGPPAVVLLTMVHDTRVEFRTVWLSDAMALPQVLRHRPRQVGCLRLFTGSGCGNTIRHCLSRRGQRYREMFQPSIRGLSRLLHEGRLKDLDTLLQALPQDRPEAPFDFFLGVYCVQIMQRTRHKLPHIARAAAMAFCRYWHYGGQAAQRQLPTPWDLAAAILRTPVAPQYTPHGRDAS
jgi:pimeloyl-ACP methyl ester carboxylesterase